MTDVVLVAATVVAFCLLALLTGLLDRGGDA